MCGDNNATTRMMKKVCSSEMVLLLLVYYAEFSVAGGWLLQARYGCFLLQLYHRTRKNDKGVLLCTTARQ
jgi:hypothetical protein